MLTNCIKSVMQRKYNNYRIYLHNFSNFDAVFLFYVLSTLTDNIKPIINDGKFVDLKFSFAQEKYKIYFRDSLLMLPSSLNKLCKSFNVESKTIFPYDFVCEDLIYKNYVGPVPQFNKFSNISDIKRVISIDFFPFRIFYRISSVLFHHLIHYH